MGTTELKPSWGRRGLDEAVDLLGLGVGVGRIDLRPSGRLELALLLGWTQVELRSSSRAGCRRTTVDRPDRVRLISQELQVNEVPMARVQPETFERNNGPRTTTAGGRAPASRNGLPSES